MQEQTEQLLEKELQVNLLSAHLQVSEEKLSQFKTATAEDGEMQLVIKKYWIFCEELSLSEGLVFKTPRLVVPNTLKEEMLQKFHEPHLGIVKCKERARDALFWPGFFKTN